MSLDEIREKWKHVESDASANAAKWNALSSGFSEMPVPTEKNDEFMAFLKKTYVGEHENAIDIGCGAGQYSLALSLEFKNVLGIDISPKMIDYAGNKAVEENITNVSFRIADWEQLQPGDPIQQQKYELVMGHMTPAIGSATALERMCEICNGMCYITKPTRRHDPVSDNVRKIAGMGSRSDPDMIPNILSMVWYLGYNPRTEYWKSHWDTKRPLDKTMDFYLNDIRESNKMTPAIEKEIVEYLRSLAIDGIIQEDVDVLITNVYWDCSSDR